MFQGQTRMRHDRLLLASLMLAASPAPGRAEAIYTETQGRGCRPLAADDGGTIWRCEGPAGYAAVFLDNGNMLQVRYGPGGRDRFAGRLQWRGAPGPRVEWQLAAGKPVAAILRIHVRDDDDRPQDQLLVAKVTPLGSCEIARIDARQAGANLAARQLALGKAASLDCGKPGSLD